VYGVFGLRVADASVIPTTPAANSMLTTYMVAERLASMITAGSRSEATTVRAPK
jgi:choline dehydrogenase